MFGKQVLDDPEPAGLKRMNKTDWPDQARSLRCLVRSRELTPSDAQYPAVVGENAAPVEGDSPEAALLRPLLRQTQLEFQPLALAYDAAQHGWSEAAFHERLDGMGAAVLVVQTKGGSICGGYNPKGWLGYGDWRDAISAFLFTWPDGNTAAPALKLPKTVRWPRARASGAVSTLGPVAARRAGALWCTPCFADTRRPNPRRAAAAWLS